MNVINHWRIQAWNGHGIQLRFMDTLNKMGVTHAPKMRKTRFWDDDWL